MGETVFLHFITDYVAKGTNRKVFKFLYEYHKCVRIFFIQKMYLRNK